VRNFEDNMHRGFIVLMKRKIIGYVAIHCVIHRHQSVVRHYSAELYHSLSIVLKCLSKIKTLNDTVH